MKKKLTKAAPNYHFTIERQSDLLANVEVWDPPVEGVFEKGHFHSYYEILIFKKGGGTHQMADEIFEVEDYSIHILTNNTFHELKRAAKTDGFEIIFSEVFLEQLQRFDVITNYLQYFSRSHVLNFTEEEFRDFQIFFDELIKQKENKSFFYNLVSLIILKIISSPLNQIKSPSNITFEKNLLALLSKHYKEKLGLDFYASKLNLSLNSLQRHTKTAFGKSLTEMQNEKIIQEVKFLLSYTDMSIKEILSDFNFADESHFTHFFKKHIGISPSSYRKSSVG